MNNNFCNFIEDKTSNRLVVVFSGVNAKSFMGYKLIKDFKCNKLFIREENKSWYHSKIDGVSDDIDSLIKLIHRYTNKFENENITFIGSSMGGYAALIIGTKLNIKNIIAFGPQIIINKHLPNNPKDDNYIKYKNLTQFINISNSNIDIFLGINELCDMYHIKDIKQRDNITIYKIFGQPHNVMYFLNKLNILKTYIYNKIFNIKHILNFHKDYIEFNKNKYLEKAVELFYIKKNYPKAKEIFDILSIEFPIINTYWKFSGICSYLNKNYDEAIQLFDNAKLIVSRDEELHYYLGLSYFNKKNYLEASNCFKYVIEISLNQKLKYFIKLAISLREQKEYEKALNTLRDSLSINSKNYGTYYQMGLIHKLLNNNQNAIENFKIANQLNPQNQKIKEELLSR